MWELFSLAFPLALLEVDFERDPSPAKAFESADPGRVFSDPALLTDHRAAPADFPHTEAVDRQQRCGFLRRRSVA